MSTEQQSMIRIELVDGTGGVYVTTVPVKSFEPTDVARAAGECAGWFIDQYRADYERPRGTWDPKEYQRRRAERAQ